MGKISFIYPKVEFYGYKPNIENIAGITYGKEKSSSNIKERLIKRGHNSVFRHETHYFKFKTTISNIRAKVNKIIATNSHIAYIFTEDYCYLAINGNTLIDIKKDKYAYNIFKSIEDYEVDVEEFDNNVAGMITRPTFKFTTSISVTREFNRVSPNNIIERSTRYVNSSTKGHIGVLSKFMIDKGVKPFETSTNVIKYTEDINNAIKSVKNYAILYHILCSICDNFSKYNDMIDYDYKPEEARMVLPLCTMTEVIYTYTKLQWLNILNLRLHDVSGKAHDDIKMLMVEVANFLNYNEIFDINKWMIDNNIERCNIGDGIVSRNTKYKIKI